MWKVNAALWHVKGWKPRRWASGWSLDPSILLLVRKVRAVEGKSYGLRMVDFCEQEGRETGLKLKL